MQNSVLKSIAAPGAVLLALSASSLISFASPATDADALLAKMTLDEKIGQMVQADCGALRDKGDVKKYFIGSVLSGGSSDPTDNRPETWRKFVDEFQAQALQTRLKIPILYGVDRSEERRVGKECRSRWSP